MGRVVVFILFILGLVSQAYGLEAPTSNPIVTVTGKITQSNSPEGVELDLEMLEALPQHTLVTATPWYRDVRSFRGPLLRDVLKLVGAKGDRLIVTALNDYQSEAPIQDSLQYPVILALSMNGKPLSVRDKGPSFIVYPFDQHPELKSDSIYTRCVWQIKTIHLE